MKLTSPFLFVYGTLRKGCANRFAQLLQAQARWMGPARIRGKLYRIAEYPGAVLACSTYDWIQGELYKLADPDSLLPLLDEYEGAAYKRKLTHVFPGSGSQTEAWVYEYMLDITAKEQIPSGDFLNPSENS
jgi:gamma-glutamylcyclotransferase (GGCT)/AIG2-like uncharacterized protein YtfP